MKKITEKNLIFAQKANNAWEKSNLLKFGKKSYFWIFFAAVNAAMAWLLAWQPLYFLFFLAAILFLVFVFWKTEEGLIALVFYLPFQIALNVAPNIDLASGRLFIVILFLVWLVKSLAEKKMDVPNKPVSWLLFSFLGLAALSAFFSINPEKAMVRLLFFLSIVPIFFVSAAYLKSGSKIIKAFYVLLFSAAIAAIAGIVQFLSQLVFGIDAIMDFWSENIAYLFYGQAFGKAVVSNPSWLVNIGGETYFRAISFFPDPHMFSFYLGLVAPIALCLAVFSNVFNFSFWQKFLLYICNAILFLALVLAFSRAGYLAFFFGIGAVIFLSWKYLKTKIKLLISALFFFAIVGAMAIPNPLTARLYDIFNFSEGSNAGRLLNWRQAVKVIDKYPLTGVGVGAYAEALDARAEERSSVTAHNTYLDIAAEMGIPAMLVWLLVLLTAIKNILAILRFKKEELTKEKVFSIGVIGALVWFSVQMFFDTAIYSPVLLAILMIYLAISINLGKAERD